MINAGFETGDFTGWDVIEESDSVTISSGDEYASPLWGNYMAVLGTPGASTQTPGPNTISQSFSLASDTLYFAYNVMTDDGEPGYDNFAYEVEVMSSGSIIASYEIDSSDIVPGWQYVLLNVTGYIGNDITLTVTAGGTDDTILATWAYFDAYEL